MTHTVINILTAKYEGDYCLDLKFDDGMEQTIDFKTFLTRARHPAIRAYLDPAKFAAFRIEYGELIWGDYDLCFPIIDLYRNQLKHDTHQEFAA